MIGAGRRLLLAGTALLGLLCAGCGYALQGTKIEGIPDYISAIAVDPFENRTQDTPMTALSVTIERDLRAALGDELPPPYEPTGGASQITM